MKNYWRLIREVKDHLFVLSLAVGFMILTSILSASPITLIVPMVDRILAGQTITLPNYDSMPHGVQDLVDRLNATSRLVLLQLAVGIALVMTVLYGIAEYFKTYFMSQTSQLVVRDLKNKIYDRLIALPLRFFGEMKTGVLVSRVTYDTGVIRDAIAEGITDLFFQPIQLLSHLGVLLWIRWVFGIPWGFIMVVTLVLPLIVYPIVHLGKRLRKISRESQEQMSDIHVSLIETIVGIRVVQGYGMEDYEKKRFHGQNNEYYKTMMRSTARMNIIRPIADVIFVGCFSMVLYVGGAQVVQYHLSPGAFMAFLTALFSLIRPFKRLSRLHSINQNAMAAADRIYQILDTPNPIADPEKPVYLSGVKESISYRGVNFGYLPERRILSNISLEIKKGEVIAIVGPSGSGKTTLVNLLPRFYDPDEGQILIDGTDVRSMSVRSLRRNIAIVTQDVILFNDTVASNIAYGSTEANQTSIEKAARSAHAHDFIMRLPQGYQTPVGDRGIRLSGGEKQRIAIARALFKDSPILILDEATSNLDSESEKLVQGALDNLIQGRTVFVIAHRLSTITRADRILVLVEGQVREAGTHEELVGLNGLYKRYFDLQFQFV